jgi:hypothetical protein
MNLRLKHLERVVAQTRGTQKVIRVLGGIEGAPLVRVTHGNFVLIGPMAALEVEDPHEQASASAQASSKAIG